VAVAIVVVVVAVAMARGRTRRAAGVARRAEATAAGGRRVVVSRVEVLMEPVGGERAVAHVLLEKSVGDAAVPGEDGGDCCAAVHGGLL
jgi:hypothetical protein